VGRRTQLVVDVEAHLAYLEGRHHFAKGTPAELAQAKALFERAIEQDPSFALAYDALAELHWYLGLFGGVPPREAFSMSTWHALRALEIDDGLAETHALLGMLRKELDYNWREVDRELRRAFELNRESPLVRLRHAISGLLPHGRMAEALEEVERVLTLDPLSLFVRWWLSVMAYLAGRPDRVIEEGRHMIALDPGHFFGHWASGIGLEAAGEPQKAVAALERAHQLSGGIPFTLGFLAFAFGRAGRHDDALALAAQAEQATAVAYIPPFTLALAHIGLEDWGPAFAWMDRAVEARDPLIMPVKSYPFLQPVRDDSRYGALLKKMNLENAGHSLAHSMNAL
jgi:tetratricopeptide (TPR) repeat protein